ncbi:unnamed protein product [Mytilus edulis]|uniref:Uncharacterized protein n=1 Tax=Mytilus edulis TaxID=6550 RepID=A0A8S3Q6H1_MYTED|nr:unnamed protein product [Mytilus edulis]
MMLVLPNKNIENLTPTLQKRISTKLSNISGCSLLPNGRMVLSCYRRDKIISHKSDGSKDFEIQTLGLTFDVVFIGDDSIAVTSGSSNQIYIIDIKRRILKESIKVNSSNGGVVCKYGHLIYCAQEKGLKIISLDDRIITKISNTKLPIFAYVTAFGDKLFYTDYTKNNVICCAYHGNTIWTFCDRSVLMSPLGISVDNDGNVYVAGNYTHNVVIISPDGQRYRQL